MHKLDITLNNIQGLICHKSQPARNDTWLHYWVIRKIVGDHTIYRRVYIIQTRGHRKNSAHFIILLQLPF